MSIYDPSDIGNDINSFNVVECCEFTPMDIYILIPNLGYGFVAHVVESFAKDFHKLVPGPNFSIAFEEDTKRKLGGSSALLQEKEKFVVMGGDTELGHVLTKISLNSQCTRKVRISPSLRLPIPFGVRDTSGSTASTLVCTNDIVKTEQLALYGMMTSLAKNDSSDNLATKIAKGVASLHFRAASDLTEKKGDLDPTLGNKFTGISGEGDDRVEFTHLFPDSYGTDEEGKQKTLYSDSVGKPTTDVPWEECTLRPSVFVSYTNDNGDLRVYYSPELTEQILKNIKIEGKDTAPKLEFEKLVYAFGVAEDKRADMQDWMEFVTLGEEELVTGVSYSDIFTGSAFMPKSIFSDELHTGNIEDITIQDRDNPEAETTLSATLITPFPPLFTNGEVYRDSPDEGDTKFYVPFSQQYILPVASYSRAATRETVPCELCGSTGNVGFSHCVVCEGSRDGSGMKSTGIVCPTCLENTEAGESVLGYVSTECSYCKTAGNEWSKISREYISVEVQYPTMLANNLRTGLLGKIPCPTCFSQAVSAGNSVPGTGHNERVAAFNNRLGKGPTGGTCTECNGKGWVICPGCVGNPDGLSATPGYWRGKCPSCYDEESEVYLGMDPPVAGRLLCTPESLAFAASDPLTGSIYGHLYELSAPTCNGTGELSPTTCPACGNTELKLTNRFFGGPYGTSDLGIVAQGSDRFFEATVEGEDVATFTTEAYLREADISALNNTVLYVKINVGPGSQNFASTSEWGKDVVSETNSEDIPFKWVPPYMYELKAETGYSKVIFYGKLPAGSIMRVYAPDQFAFSTPAEPLGYTLTSSIPNLVDGTVFDGGMWLYVADTADVPIESVIRSLDTQDIEDFVYYATGEAVPLSMALYLEGFANLTHAVQKFYSLVGDHKKALQHICTTRMTYGLTAGCPSRFIYAPSNATDKVISYGPEEKESNDTSWIKLTPFDEVVSLGQGFLAADSSRGTTLTELDNEYTPDVSSLLSSIPTEEEQCAPLETSVSVLQMSGYGGLVYCEPDHDHRFAHISRASATTIKSNVSGNDITASVGVPVLYPLDMLSSSSETFPKPFNPIAEATDIPISNDGVIDTKVAFSSFLTVDSSSLCKFILELVEDLKIMMGKLDAAIYEVLIKTDIDWTKFGESVVFSTSQDGAISRWIQGAKGYLGAGEDASTNVRAFIDALTEYKSIIESGETTRPMNLTQLSIMAVGDYYMAADLLSSIASHLVKPREVDGGIETTMAAIDGNKVSTEVVFDNSLLHTGLYVYNLRKAYFVLVSMISCLVATIERIIVYSYALSKNYDPFPYTTEESENTCDFRIYGFQNENGEPVYPKIANDIDLSALDNNTANLNRITPFTNNETDIKYDIKIEIPDIDEATLKPLPILGLGVTEAMKDKVPCWEDQDRYATAKRGIFDSFISGDKDITDLDLPSLSGISDIQETLSTRDYMYYSSDSEVTYFDQDNNQATIGLSDLATAIQNSTAGVALPSIAETSVEGEILMSDIFPFLAGGPVVIPLSMALKVQNVEFVSGRPWGLSIPSGSHILNGIVEDTTAIFTDPETAVANIRQVSQDVTSFLTLPLNVMMVYERMKDEGDYEYIYPIIGQADTILTGKGDSLATCFLMREAGATLKGDYAIEDGSVDTDAIGTIMYDESGTSWTTVGTSNDDIANYNLWLSKRRAYAVLVMMISSMAYTRRTTSPLWETSTGYIVGDMARKSDEETKAYLCIQDHTSSDISELDNASIWTSISWDANIVDGEVIMRDKTVVLRNPTTEETNTFMVDLKYSVAEIADSDPMYARRMFHCYGFGSLLQPGETGDNDARKNHRVTYILPNLPASQDSARMWAFSHLSRSVQASFCTDLEISETQPAPPSNSYVGGWGCPKLGSDEMWKDKWVTLNSSAYADPAVASTNTDTFLRALWELMCTGTPSFESVLQRIKEISADPGPVNAAINTFMGTMAGMQAFSVPRTGNLTDKIWLVITKLS